MSTFDSILGRLEEIKKIGGFKSEEIDSLKKHYRVSKSDLLVDGDKLPAWRIVHNQALGPAKGGIRFHPEVSEDEVKSLSFWMSLKNSLLGLPYGGAKGGVRFNPKGKSPEYLEKVARAYGGAFYKVLGQDIDIPAPDVYTDSQIMAWVLDEYEKKVGHHEPGMITGKPIELGGIALRADATASGAYLIFSELVKVSPLLSSRAKRGDLSVAIQGFGNAGANLAEILEQNGYKVVAVSDSRGGIYEANGLGIKKVVKAKNEKGSVVDYLSFVSFPPRIAVRGKLQRESSSGSPIKSGMTAKLISNEELLKLPVDVLFLAALENQIKEDNAGEIQAKNILELANGPITPEADKILFKKGIPIVPDILTNAGGVVVSYFEWAQNRTGNILDEEYLKNKLEVMMKDACKRVMVQAKEFENKIDLRTAAYIIAIRRILAAARYRGDL